MLLPTATDAECAAAVENNLFDFFRALMPLPGSDLFESDRLCYHHTFLKGPFFNSIWRARLDSADADSAITQALDWFRGRGMAQTAWWITETTQPADLAARLAAHGFTPHYEHDPGMAADLNALRDTLPPPDGFSITRAETPAALDVWRDTLCAAFGLPLAGGQAWIDATLAFGIERAPWRHYTGFLNGAPVATSFSFNGGGVVGLFCIAVMPEARGRGIGAAITRQPLIDARAEGVNIGVLFASPLGVPVYRRLGFRDVGSRISRYGWVDPDAGKGVERR